MAGVNGNFTYNVPSSKGNKKVAKLSFYNCHILTRGNLMQGNLTQCSKPFALAHCWIWTWGGKLIYCFVYNVQIPRLEASETSRPIPWFFANLYLARRTVNCSEKDGKIWFIHLNFATPTPTTGGLLRYEPLFGPWPPTNLSSKWRRALV